MHDPVKVKSLIVEAIGNASEHPGETQSVTFTRADLMAMAERVYETLKSRGCLNEKKN